MPVLGINFIRFDYLILDLDLTEGKRLVKENINTSFMNYIYSVCTKKYLYKI